MHPVPIYVQDNEKEKRPETRYQSPFELQNMIRKIPFSVWPFKSENCEKEKRKAAVFKVFNISRTISQEQKELLRGNKNHFS